MITILVALMTLWLVVRYIREIYIFHKTPDKFDELVTSKMRGGELDGPELSNKARLIFGYPFMIAVGVFVSGALIWEAVG